jgi:hypothetical protein
MQGTNYHITIELLERMLGTVPKSPDIYKAYIASKAADLGLAEEEIATVESLEEKGWTGFHRDEQGPFLYNYTVKGFLCESARTLKQWGTLKQLQDKFKRYVFVNPRRIRLPEPAGVLERPLRAQTAQGPRVALTRSDYVAEGTQLEFVLEVLEGSGITENCLKDVLSYGSRLGLGQWRTGSWGTFKIVSLEVQ